MAWSRTWTFVDGEWVEGNAAIVGPRSHAFWLASSVFDGARVFEGVAPDLDRHFTRVNASATAMGLDPGVSVEQMLELAEDGRKRFPAGDALYVRPMYWAEEGGFYGVAPRAESTRFCLCLYESPMPEPTGFSITLSPFRRPTRDTALTDAKAGCLYPNSGRALIEAQKRGFDNAVLLDAIGHVAETATSNIFIVKDGVVATPASNGTFLAGITRSRLIGLLRGAGVPVEERAVSWGEVAEADEVFSSGNYAKVVPITRVEQRALQPGPMFRRARELYWDFAHSR